MFSAVASAFIIQIIPALQPNPADLTNVLLLRILQQNTSFDGADPLAPVSNIPISAVRAQSILVASLACTLLVSFGSVVGKQWIYIYTRVSARGNVADRGEKRQAKLLGLQKWGVHYILDTLPLLLQVDLTLFGIALAIYFWDLNITVAKVVLAAIFVGFAVSSFFTVVETVRRDFPLQTFLFLLLPKALRWIRKFYARLLRRKATTPQSRVEQPEGHALPPNPLNRMFKTPGGTTSPAPPDVDYPMTFSNPAFWRQDPLFNPPIQKDVRASAALWLLENSTDFSNATAVAAAFFEFQWPSHLPSPTALIRLRDTYMECFRGPECREPTRIKALQSAAAYYVLYHTQFIWSTWKGLDFEVEKLPTDLPPDLLHQYEDKWDGQDLFGYLLRLGDNDRSEPVKSTRFLSYIAPYWFCGDSDAAVRSRTDRLQTLNELIGVLDKSRALNPTTLANCILCAGAAIDFPLHPKDLIRVDKRCAPLSSCVGSRFD